MHLQAMLALSMVFQPAPHAPGTAALPPLTMTMQRTHEHAVISPPSSLSEALVFPGSSTMIADDNGKWFGNEADAFAAAAIPVALVSILFVFYRVLKMFISAF